MNPVDAIRLMVAHADGGWDAMGVLCGKSGETLRKAFSGKDERYVPSMTDAAIIAEACIANGSKHCRAWHDAINNIGADRVDAGAQVSGPQTLRADFAAIIKEASDVLLTGTETLADNNMSDNDYRRNCRELAELKEAVTKAERDLEASYRAGRQYPRAAT